MAIRYKALTELYQETQRKVTAPAEWQQFLTSACRNYRLSFDEQLLVYAQRPDATAVLEIERWNKRFGRWVNRGANGIAVFDGEHSGKQRLKYYFDVSDTHAGRFTRPVPLWTVRPEYAPDIIEAMENSFGELEQKDDLGAALLSAAKNAVEDNIHDYLSELSHLTAGSFLEELDEYNVEVMYRRALQASIGYMLVVRCGLDPSDYYEDDDFRDVLNFNTPETLNALGVATGDISQMCLSEIARTTLALQRQPQKENRTFETTQENQYPVTEQKIKQPERSIEYDRDHIQQTGQLQPAEPSAPAGAGSGSWEIRITSPEVPEGEPQDHLHQSADQRQAERPSGGGRADGSLPDGSDGGADGQKRGRDGGTESPRSDEVGAAHEQPSERSGGNDSRGADLQLTEENAGGEELPAFLDEKQIMAVIANKDDDLKYKKQQIELFFSVHTDQRERADYLKSAYQDRYTEIIADGQRLGYKPQEDGLLMWEGSYLSRTKESVFSWDLVAGWTAQLIDKKEYFIQTDIRQLPTQESQQMSLFDFPSFGSSTPSEGEPQRSLFSRPALSQQVIDEALCIGANDQNSRLIICAYFKKDKPLEDNTRFLMEHYGENGAGFYLDSRKYSIWYNTEGIHVAEGETAQRTAATLIPWEQAAKRIRELLDLGRYMPQSELDQVDGYERQQRAAQLWYLRQDFAEGTADAGFLPTINAIYSRHKGFPDESAAIEELLNSPDTLQTVRDELEGFIKAYEYDKELLRFRFHRPQKLLEQISDLQREPLHFTAAEGYDPQRRFFISGDEIDNLLRGGKRSTDYRLAVYSFYRNHSDRKERENFLKHYHGEYSGSHNGNDDVTYQLSKGVHFSHGSLSEPYAKVELKWNAVEKRVSAMIAQGRFLSDEDRAAMPQYEKHQLAQNIRAFFENVPQEQAHPYPYGFDYWDAVKLIEPQLDDPARVEEIYQMMLPVWEATPQDDRMYALRQRAFENLTAYRQGTFTLFAEKKEPVSPQAVQEPQKAYDLGFGHLGNGLTVWNRLEEVDGDYRTVAHIAPDRTVQIYDEEMPQEVRDRIQQVADTSEMTVSTTQNAPVFSVLPREEPPQKEETADLYPVLAAQVLRFIGEFDGSRMGYGEDDAQAVENIAQQLQNTAQRQEIRALLQSFLDHADPEEEVTADVALCMEQIDELPQPLTVEQVQQEEIRAYLDEAGYAVSDELIEIGLAEYRAHGGKGNNEDVADFIEREFLSEEPEPVSLDDAKKLINDFCETAYDGPADFSDLEKVGIAYTTITDEEIPIQVNVDLVNYRVERYLNGQFLERRQYDSLEALIQNELTDLDFDDLVSVSEEELESIGVSQDDYRLLSRLKADCDYYLGAGGRAEKHLWAGSVKAQIAKMRELYDVLSEKPEWLTEQDIDRYESQMTDGPELSQPQKEEPAPLAPKRVRRERVTFAPLHPEIPREQRHDFHITDDALGHGTPGEKFAANVRAIRCLKRIEAEERLATPEEQEILSRYVGWGGLPQCFEETYSKYAELKSLLDEDEYAAARASSLTAFYTPPVVIRGIYKALAQMGFQQGNLLEPACGTGNFIGLLPADMAGSKAYGVEIDSISGRIAQQLYQNASISVNGFETVQMPDSFFDVAIGNVPFGDFKVVDRRYNKHHWLIHDYFFGKALDKVRPGGIVAFITSKGTMDKENSAVRRYLAQRADLIGAIRLPDNTFKQNAGTEVTSDILFLQKRDHITDLEQDWVQLDTDENGIRMNRYFVQHPEMVLGDMVMESTRFGMDSACKAREGADLSEQLAEAIQFLQAEIKPYELEEPDEEEDRSIPADPTVWNFSYTIVDGQVYYRENSLMHPMEVSVTAENRIRGMIELRECVRRLIEYQTEGYPDEDIQAEQKKLNSLYDSFTAKYGLISSRGNKLAFSEDSSYCLLCSLEVLDEQGNLKRKADMFSKRTIRPHVDVTSVDTASEALAVSISEKACVDMDYMAELSGKSPEELESELAGVIFRNIEGPENPDELRENSLSLQAFSLVTADEYLSGNVRRKLRMAKAFWETAPDSQKEAARRQVEALEAVQPADLGAGEIGVRIGANWVPIDIYQQFMVELLTPGYYARNRIKILRSEVTGQWAITEKNSDRGNVKVLTTYGTKRMTAYHILEQTLNQKDVRVFDYIEDENGNKKAVLNKKETAIAQDRQELIKQKFSEWIWRDIDRRERLCRIYNETFNSIRPREYDGRHIHFEGMNPEISLRPHQINAIAHVLYGGNTLLAHEVGAGKTYEMVAAAMEMKRLGLCTKSLIVVPNHITEQWAAEFLQLYPSANILVATKKDFEKQNRKKFCSRISTGDYDAIIIGHSQFEKIPMSAERQQAILQQQIDEILFGIEQAKSQKAERYTIKQMERTRKSLEAKLAKLNDQSRKDDVVTFEELGVDRIFIDESHYFKNLFLMTKMRNVGGIAQTEAQKSSDLFMKCQYLDELTGGRGVIFATGTPISNSMVELYTIQRYLQYRTLQEMGLIHFDDWASNFGETITAIELSPEGSGYRAKTRFAKFYNLPELMSVFKQVADIQTADMLHLPVPKANFHTEVIKPSEIQQEMIKGLAERAEKIRGGGVDPHVDNMLRITNDGRKLALDMRLIQPLAPDDPDGKVAVCARNLYRIWEQTKEKRSTQLVFCDLSTPTTDGSFSVYDDLKKKLLDAGIPEDEIAFIHDADSEAKKKELFAKVRAGQVRILMGSTQKMGAGTNVQDRLIALHDLDCPWRPSDLQQRLGRIVRQGNENEEVEIFRYVTEGTFDAYLYQLVENKQKFIAQIMTSKAPVRVADDVDETALSYSEIKALATGNPLIIEKCNLDMEVARLNMLKASHLNQVYSLEELVHRKYPAEITRLTERIAGYERDVELAKAHPKAQEGFCGMEVDGKHYTEKEDAGKAIIDVCTKMTGSDAVLLGQYRGFSMVLAYDGMSNEYRITLKGTLSHTVTLGADVFGNITRLDNALENLAGNLDAERAKLEEAKVQLENARTELATPFAREDELTEKTARLKELNILLNMDEKDKTLIDEAPDEGEEPPVRKVVGLER
ncbi:DNA methylase [Erysipelotrichaceae bacterium AM07-35-1]|nr:DNA methylase [Erysipelotrichaceae bacterium AM07-35-1]